MRERILVTSMVLVMAGIFSLTTAFHRCAGTLFDSDPSDPSVPGTGGGGGGGPVPTPTPSQAQLFNDGLEQHYTGPVPDEIVQATGQTTWAGVLAWMDQQMAAQGLNPQTFTGSVTVTQNTATGTSDVVVEFAETPDANAPAPTATPEPPIPEATP